MPSMEISAKVPLKEKLPKKTFFFLTIFEISNLRFQILETIS